MGAEAPNSDIHDTSIVDYEIAVRAIPQFDTQSPKMISQGPSVCIFNKEDPQEVLASWLFVQYLVSEKVQLAYSATEGYAPVTTQAQQSAKYLDYLSRAGEDNENYYDVKIQATKLLLENTENTFITPVFNGSASLRNAAGQMIEETVKRIRRKKTVDDEFIEVELYDKMVSLYKLNLNVDTATYKAELGPLPTGSIVLLSVIGGTWLVLGSVFIANYVKKQKKTRNFQN